MGREDDGETTGPREFTLPEPRGISRLEGSSGDLPVHYEWILGWVHRDRSLVNGTTETPALEDGQVHWGLCVLCLPVPVYLCEMDDG